MRFSHVFVGTTLEHAAPHTFRGCTVDYNRWEVYFYVHLSVRETAVISVSSFCTKKEAAWKLIMCSREKAPVKAQRPVRVKVERGFLCRANVSLNVALSYQVKPRLVPLRPQQATERNVNTLRFRFSASIYYIFWPCVNDWICLSRILVCHPSLE